MKHKRKGLKLLILFALAIVGGIYFPHDRAFAAASAVQVAAVEYYNENIVVFNNENTKIYYATDTEASRNIWECIPADDGDFTTIDISWLAPGSESVIIIKGDQVATKSRVVIRKKTEKLNITIDYSNLDNTDPDESIASLVNIMTTEGTAEDPIKFEDLEWRKGDNGEWKNASTLTVAQIQKFQVRGTYVNFRIMAVDDCVAINADGNQYFKQRRIDGNKEEISDFFSTVSDASFKLNTIPDGTKGRRFSNVYKIKIAKQAASMVTGVDGEKFTAAITYGKEYKVTATYPSGTKAESKWIKVTDKATKSISLATLVNSLSPAYTTAFDGMTEAFPEMHIQVRNYATATTASSKITNIDLAPQYKLKGGEIIPGAAHDLTKPQTVDSIYVDYFGDKYITLIIPMASVDNPYEYCFLKHGEAMDLAHTSWSVVTKGSGVKILSSKAIQGYTLYVRQKEIKSKAATATSSAVSYKLASTYRTAEISYPCVPMVTKDTLTFVKGYTNVLTIEVLLTKDGREKFEEEAASVLLGTKNILLKQETNGDILTLYLKVDDLKSMANCTSRALTVNFAKGTIDKTSVKLTIKNPTPAGSLTLSAGPGAAGGNINIIMTGSAAADDILVYAFGDAAETSKNIEDIFTGDATKIFTSATDIKVETGKTYITVYEINKNTKNIVRLRSIQLTTSNVSQ